MTELPLNHLSCHTSSVKVSLVFDSVPVFPSSAFCETACPSAFRKGRNTFHPSLARSELDDL